MKGTKNRATGQRGFTLLELVVSLAIAALVLPLVGGIIFMLQFYPGRTQADIQAQQDQQLVGQWITIDANRADHFNTAPVAPNEYGFFSWTEYGGASPVSVNVIYLYDPDTTSLVRRVTRDGVADRTSVVARNIASFGDVTFSFTEPTFELDPATGLFEFKRGRVTVRPTATVERVGQDPAVLTSTVVAELRAQFTVAMADPEATPTPTPPPAPPPPPAWITLEDAPANVKSGGAITNDGTDIYAFRGDRKTSFWKFDVFTGSWSLLASTPQNVKDGGALTYTTINGAPFIYGLRGDNKRNFWRYDLSVGTWEDRANAPSNVDLGGALAWDGADTIYSFGGNATRNFWGYSISNDAWSSLTNAPDDVDRGGAIVYVSEAIYALRGNISTDFWKYDVGTDTWTSPSLADTPAPVGKGGSLAWDEGDHIYALRGNITINFWRYSISANSWESLPDTLQTVDDGGGLTYIADDFYALRGGGTTDFWRFTSTTPPGNLSPTASITSPTDGSTFLPSVGIPFSGTGTDTNGVALTELSLVWTSSRDGQIGTGTSFIKTTLSAGSHTITLTATDGQGELGSDSVVITVNTPPTASISKPAQGSTFLTTDSIFFEGSGNDAEDGPLTTDSTLVWKSSDSQIGTGTSFSTSLSAGSHTITLKATDTLGAETTSAPVNITVDAPAGSRVWIPQPIALAAVNNGGAITTDGINLYAFGGGGTKNFWKFEAGTWTPLANTLQNVNAGGALTYDKDNGFIYAFRGGKKKDFWRFNTSSSPPGAWETLAPAPENVKDGGALVYLNGYVYALRGDRKSDFWRYNVASTNPIWELLANTPANVNKGGSLATNGTSIYALRGDGKKDFWKYSVGESAWTTTLQDTPGSVSSGGSLAADGATTIYALGGGGSKGFWKFDIDSVSGSWTTTPPDAPLNVNAGGALELLNGEVYALIGGGTVDFWKY